MAALCTAAAATQHVSFRKGIGQQVSIQSPHNHPRKFASNYSVLSSKEFVAEGVAHKAHASTRKKRFITTCVVTTAVVEQDTEVKPTSSSPPLNLESSEASSTSDTPVLKPAPRPVAVPRPQPQPQPRPRPNPAIVDSKRTVDNNARPPRLNGAKPAITESPYRQVFRPGDSHGKPGGNSEPVKSSIDSLGQILEKAEKLKEQKTASKEQKTVAVQRDSNQQQSNRFVKSTWRKGMGLETPPPTDSTQAPASGPDERPRSSDIVKGAVTRTTGPSGSGMTSSAPSAPSPVQVEVKRPEIRGPSLKAPLKPPLSRDDSPKKQVILKDIGAKDQGGGAGRAGQVVSKPSSGKPQTTGKPSAAADPFLGPVKPGKAGSAKGKDNKEDWRKKSAPSGDGLKRRVGLKGSAPDDALDADIPGAAVVTRRGGRKMSKATRKAAREQAARAAAPVKVAMLEIGDLGMSVPDLAQKLAVNDADIIKTLFMKGISTTVNQTLDEETIKLVCEEFGVEVVEAGSVKLEDMAKKTEFLDEEDLDNLQVRPPVVTIMGHVDHGKTSLMDFIRKSKVAASEAGGITQGIGAYRVSATVNGEEQLCVFLDTPGHEAFTAMRARGARVTDVAVIVVAADDGVRPQTEEAIAHAKAANVPIVVAINKIDKEGAEPERVMQELSGMGLMPEDWGGDIPMVKVSALKGENVDSLLETIMLVAEFQELKANPNRSAKGTVIESCLDKTKGVLATLLVQNGTLKKGDVVLCGEAYGKIRALLDDSGARVEEAGPSTAVQVFGLSSVPTAGEKFEVLESLEIARDRAEECAVAARLTRLAAQAAEGKVTLASVATSVAEGKEGGVERHQLNVILKADVQGSLEAIREALRTLPQDTVNLRMLLQAAGDVTVSDVDLGIASEGIIIGFNVSSPSAVQSYAESKGVEIRLYTVIYQLIDDIRNAMEGMLDVVQEEVSIGKAEVRAIFSSGSGKVAGCMVTEGKLAKGCGIKIIRGSAVMHSGKLVSLRRVKELAKEVVAGLECGVGVEKFDEWQEGDIIEAFNLVAKKRSLEEASVSTASSLAAVAASASSTMRNLSSTPASASSPKAS